MKRAIAIGCWAAAFLMSGSLNSFAQDEIVANGEVAEFVEEKVAAGEEVQKEEIVEIISESVSADAEKTFKSCIADPIPAGVKILEGESSHWQGFSAAVVFTADEQTFEELKTGYYRIPFDGLKPLVDEWFKEEKISDKTNIITYFRNDNLNKYYMLWDPETKRIFFKGMEAKS